LQTVGREKSLTDCLRVTNQPTAMTKENILLVAKVYAIITDTFNQFDEQIKDYIDFVTPFGSSTFDENAKIYGDIDIAIFLKPWLTDEQKEHITKIMPQMQTALTKKLTDENTVPLMFNSVAKEPAKTKTEELLLHWLVYDCWQNQEDQQYCWEYDNVQFGIESLRENPPTVVDFLREEVEKRKNSPNPWLLYGTISSNPIPTKIVTAQVIISQRYGWLQNIINTENNTPWSLAIAMKYFACK